MDVVVSLPTVDLLRDYVRKVLCDHDQLDPDQSPLSQWLITRGDKRPCGLHFEVQGPRRVRSYAVWAGEEGRILFYDGKGQRFALVKVSEAPDPLKLA